MSSCEKCWTDSQLMGMHYIDLLKQRERDGQVCTPEQQAGSGAGICEVCGRKTRHEATQERMCGCSSPLNNLEHP